MLSENGGFRGTAMDRGESPGEKGELSEISPPIDCRCGIRYTADAGPLSDGLPAARPGSSRFALGGASVSDRWRSSEAFGGDEAVVWAARSFL